LRGKENILENVFYVLITVAEEYADMWDQYERQLINDK